MLQVLVGLDDSLYKTRTPDLPREAVPITHEWIFVIHHCVHVLFNTVSSLVTNFSITFRTKVFVLQETFGGPRQRHYARRKPMTVECDLSAVLVTMFRTW